MQQAALELVASTTSFDRLPFTIPPKSRTSIATVLLLLPAVAALLVPVALLAAFAAPAFWGATEHPLAAVQVAAGLAVWTLLFVVPARRIIQRVATTRDVRIEGQLVAVRESGPFGTRAWTLPVSEFAGVAHHVRTSLSGVRHELFLVHPDHAKSVLLHESDAIPEATVARTTDLLGLPRLPAAALYRFGPRLQKAPVAPSLVAERLAA